MNRDLVGTVAERVGAVAVVVTLRFVARDIRQNFTILSMSATRDLTAIWNQWSDMIATSGDLAVHAAIVRRRTGIPGFEVWWPGNTGDCGNEFVSRIDKPESGPRP